MQTLNIDIRAMYNDIRKYRKEAYLNQSNGVQAFHPKDIERQKSYIAALRSRLEKAVRTPVPDKPETHPSPYTLVDMEVLPEVENETSNTMVQKWHDIAMELVDSQSSRYAASMLSFDAERIEDLIVDLEDEIEYAENSLPLDLPDSSPTKAIAPPGQRGTIR